MHRINRSSFFRPRLHPATQPAYSIFRFFTIALTLLLLLHSLIAPTFAQSRGASLAGRVNDQSGAVLSGARVTLQQKSNGFEHTIITDETGASICRKPSTC
jgi:hypothetical protein